MISHTRIIERDEDELVSRVEYQFQNDSIPTEEDEDNRFIVRRDGCAELFADCFHLCEPEHVSEFMTLIVNLRAEVEKEFGF